MTKEEFKFHFDKWQQNTEELEIDLSDEEIARIWWNSAVDCANSQFERNLSNALRYSEEAVYIDVDGVENLIVE